MDRQLADNLSRQLRISPDHIVREEHEMLILQAFLEERAGRALVFKGGTALRLAYGSPRYSDDLDFSLTAPLAEADFIRAAEAVATKLPRAALREALSKYFTLLAEYRIREPYLPRPFSVKLEVSTRSETWVPGRDFALRLLTSPSTPVTVLAQVATLERMRADKQAALAARRQPRDLYDLWFIAQKLRQPFVADLAGIDRAAIRRDLRKYLPTHHWPVIEEWSGTNRKT